MLDSCSHLVCGYQLELSRLGRTWVLLGNESVPYVHDDQLLRVYTDDGIGVRLEQLQRRHLAPDRKSLLAHVSGGVGLSGMSLYYLSPGWLIGSDVTSTSVVAYVQTTSPTPVGTAGWLMMGAHGPRSTLQ
jgi:hypothetical protein